jgi:hypothetical protein
MGLTPEVAKLIYEEGKKIRDDLRNDYGDDVDFDSDLLECGLERYMVKRVTEICNEVLKAGDGDNNWVEAMTAAGIKRELQDAIMDEEFAVVRGTQCLSAWLEEVFGNYFRTLENMDERVSELEQGISSGALTRGGAGNEDEVSPPPPFPEHRVLFKSVELNRALGVLRFKETDKGEKSYSFNLSRLATSPLYPTDFLPSGGLYFTDTLWFAKTHAQYSKHTCPPADIRIIELHVPEAHFTKLKVWELKLDNDTFKEIVWNSRRGDRLPKRLQQIRLGFQIMHGPCATRRFKNYRKMKHWSEISIEHMITRMTENEHGQLAIEMAMQYMWRNVDAIDELSSDCENKTYLRMPFKN